jgi:hypothetical protein
LRLHHRDDEWIIAGDFDWPNSEPLFETNEIVDVWSVEGSETYDPKTNAFTATAREIQTPPTYERIFIKRDGRLSVVSDGLRLFGRGC